MTFDHPPIHTITATTVAELSELVGLVEQDRDLNVVVFDSSLGCEARGELPSAELANADRRPGDRAAGNTVRASGTCSSAWGGLLSDRGPGCSPVIKEVLETSRAEPRNRRGDHVPHIFDTHVGVAVGAVAVEELLEISAPITEAMADALENAEDLPEEVSSVTQRDIAGARFVPRSDARIEQQYRLSVKSQARADASS